MRQGDIRGLAEALTECHGLTNLDDFATRTTRALLKLIPADTASYNEIDARQGQVRTVIVPASPGASGHLLAALRRYIHQHPTVSHYDRTGDGRAYRFSDFLTRDEFHRLPLYNEYYRCLGLEHQVTIRLPAGDRPIVGFALNRTQTDFSARDCLLLNLLRPHLAQAYEQAAATARMRTQLALLSRLVEQADLALIVLTAAGGIEFATRRARHLLRKYCGRPGHRVYRLPDLIAEWVTRQSVLPAADDVLPPLAPLLIPRSGQELLVRLLADAEQRVLLLEERRLGPNPVALVSLGLTTRETEVLAWLAQGKNNMEIGDLLSTRPRTVAKHVERIYRKLGVDTRAAAGARAFDAWRVSTRLVE